jgi:hypothetical protein
MTNHLRKQEYTKFLLITFYFFCILWYIRFDFFNEEFLLGKKPALLCLFALLATAAFAKPINFTLINHTNHDISEICFAATNDEEWGDDILCGDPLLDRQSMEISFDADYEARIKKENLKIFDMLCVINGKEVEFLDLELAKMTTLEISLDKKGNPVTKIK